MARYRKKPVEVEAFLFGVDNMPDWFMDKVTSKDVVLHRIPFDEARARNYGQMWCDIKTLEGTMRAYEGKDYIIKGIKGEIYPCKVDIFEETYEIPTADVVPKSEVEKWYHEYHAIKDELKQEKMYHKETEKLVDKYCTELEKSKAEIERLTINMNAYGLAVKRLAEERTEIFTEIYDRLLQSFPAQSFIDAPCTTHDRLFNMVAELKKKYTEGEPIPASEEKQFSPEDVRNMTPQEVREKYTAIRKSMERWK